MTNEQIVKKVKDIERKQRRGDELTEIELAIYKLYGGSYEVVKDN